MWGAASPGESRWPAGVAVLAVIALQFALPSALQFGPGWMWPALSLALFASLVAANPNRLTVESRDVRELSLALVAVLIVANASALVLLMQELLSSDHAIPGRRLLLSAVAIWARNVIAFGVWYWEIDRGGPIRRCTDQHGPPDFLFVQMMSPEVHRGAWSPRFIDYLYLSLTNSTAFSPTDTLPLTGRAKVLMGLQSLASLATVAVVGARAVNILS
ncbi:MAG: hypothetical protein HZB15_12635 [Actinobacteria bacterium]|nr:hypothetical protein [Actinomycetota bacterium]